jgi:hypothetical protein
MLTTPAWEYASQDGGYGDTQQYGTKRKYVDMFKNYISKIGIIRQYRGEDAEMLEY